MNKLYIIPTPIGNLEDMTLRSIRILNSVEFILCENTKITGKIKAHLKLEAKLISLHKFNELSRVEKIKGLLETHDIALVCDAGTPTVSDPGQKLIKELTGFIEVIPLPGPTAFTTALSGSGLEYDSFVFVGFLEKEETKILNKINNHLKTDVIIAYESPNRINKTLSFLLKHFGDIEIVVARELTKIYEEIVKDRISCLVDREFKGEIVLLIPTKEIQKEEDFVKLVEKLIELRMNTKDIISYLSSTDKFKKNEIYNYIKNRK